MSVYIPDMEMPTNGEALVIFSNGNAELYYSIDVDILDFPKKNRKAIPAQEHGDLIDRDVLLKECDKMAQSMEDHGREFSFSFMSNGDVCTTWYNVEIMIEDMPTIIPAERRGE